MTQSTSIKTRIKVLDTIPEKYIFHKPLQGNQAREVYQAVKARLNQDFQNVPAFEGHFEFNEGTEQIEGSSTLYGILINDELKKQDLWLPTIDQAIKLESEYANAGSVYRDFGIAVYSDANPNQKVAARFIKESGLESPFLLSFGNLKVEKGDDVLGVNISIKDNQGIIFGQEATQYLEDNNFYSGTLGACRVSRLRSGLRLAYWRLFDDAYGTGRVDIVCGEATPQNLENAVSEDIQRIGQLKVDEMNAKIQEAQKSAAQILRR